jgi:hypothetical protein
MVLPPRVALKPSQICNASPTSLALRSGPPYTRRTFALAATSERNDSDPRIVSIRVKPPGFHVGLQSRAA